MAGTPDLDLETSVFDDLALAWDDPDVDSQVTLTLTPATTYVTPNTGELPITAGLVARFDADIPSSVVADSDGRVSQWSDVSGSGFHVVQATQANKPTAYATTRNGRNVIDFSRAASQELEKLTISTTVTSVFVAFRFALQTANSAPFGTNAAAIMYAVGTTKVNLFAGSGGMSSTNDRVLGNWYSIAVVVNGASSVIQFDGTTTTPGVNPGSTVAATALYVGNDSASDFLDGSIAEILVYSDVKNATDRAAILAYLEAKWNGVGNTLGITVGAAPISLALTPAVVPSSAVALGVTTGAVDVAFTPAVVPVSAVALTASAASSLAATPAALSVQAVAVDIATTPPGTELALTPAEVAISAVALAPSLAVSVALTPATVTTTAVALAPSAAVSLALAPASTATAAVALGVTPGAASVALTPGTVPVAAVGLGISSAGAESIPVSPAAVTVTAVALGITTGAASMALTPAAVQVTPVVVAVTSAASVALTPAEVPVLALALGVAVGGASVALSPATVAVVAVTLALVRDATGGGFPPFLSTAFAVRANRSTALTVDQSSELVVSPAVSGAFAVRSNDSGDFEVCHD